MKQIIHQIHDELNMADAYVDCATHAEGEDKDVYRSISKEELNHAERLIAMGDRHASTKSHDDKCYIIWEYQKEQLVSRFYKIKAEWSLLG